MGVEFAILGPLEVRLDGAPVRVGGGRRAALLARLIVARGRAVPVEVLIDDVWEGAPPAGADATLQTHISALRRVLGGERIERAGRTYRLTVHPDELDASLAEADLAKARLRMEMGDLSEAMTAVERALERWRGEPLANHATQPWAVAEAARCDELRMQCLETALEVHLALGRPELAVTQAEMAVAHYPFRERLWAHLIIGLYRGGRQADALRAYQRLRAVLAEGLGLDPSPQLAELERSVLRQDPALDAPAVDGAGRHSCAGGGLPDIEGAEARVRLDSSGIDIPAGGRSDGAWADAERIAPSPRHTGRRSSHDAAGEDRPRTKRPRPAAVAIGAAVVGATIIGLLFSASDRRHKAPASARPGPTPTSGVPERKPAHLIATGKDPSGRTWVIEPRVTETGDVCTRLNIIGRGLSRELCEPRPTDKPFGRFSFVGLTEDGEPRYISWIVVSDRTARVETTAGDNETQTAELVVDDAVGVKCAVSYVNRLQPVRVVAFDANGQRIGETDFEPVRPPPGSSGAPIQR